MTDYALMVPDMATIRVPTLRELCTRAPQVSGSDPLRPVERAFRDDPHLRAVAVTGPDRTTLLTRLRLETMLSGRLGFGRALLSRALVGDIVEDEALRLRADLSLREAAAEILAHAGAEEDVLVLDDDGTALGIVAVSAVFREIGTVFREVALRDPLTGLPNRRMLDERGADLVAAGVAPDRMAMLYIDLDGFKQVNDTLGHQAGDELLLTFAQRLARTVRPADLAGRLGGDEFAVLLHDVSEAEASAVADRIVQLALEPFDLGGHQVQLSATVGIAVGTDLTASAAALGPLDALLHQADSAMLYAKRSGKARTGRPGEAATSGASERRALIRQRLAQAITGDQLRLHYQPKLDLRTATITSVEALVRWTDPELGTVPASELIEVAEDTGQIRSLGDWVLRTACSQARAWLDAGHAWSVAINISPLQLADATLADTVLAAVDEAGIPPRLLQVEVTESRALLDEGIASAQLRRLEGAGVTVHLDDFGTGYSSLAMLRRLPVSTLKIDQSIVERIDSDRADAELVAGVINAAHLLGLSVVAEGVERASQLECLRALDCDIVQGYLIGRPESAADVVPLIGGARARL